MWLIYTEHGANVPCLDGVSCVHGSAFGAASSADGGKTWTYRGTLNLEPVEQGLNTFFTIMRRHAFIF